MIQQVKQRSASKLFENIIAIGLMFGGLLFVFNGNTYAAALWTISAGMALSTLLILIRSYTNQTHKKLSIFAKTAFICWGLVILTFPLTFISSDLDGLIFWARTSIFIGPAGMILASIALFVTGRSQPQ